MAKDVANRTERPSVERTTPTARIHHGFPVRGLDATPSSPLSEGRFGRMFRNLPILDSSDAEILALGRAMVAEKEEDETPEGKDDAEENDAIAAGYTYLGQFIDHDITFDPISSLQRQNDPDALRDFRTPRLDLDCVYGNGSADQPYLYEPDGLHFLLGAALTGSSDGGTVDLPRNSAGRALIGDPRNDENVIVSQLQSVFLRFHNKVVDLPELRGLPADDRFKEAQRLVRWHYQWVVVHDFLPTIVGTDVVKDILRVETYRANGKHVEVVRPRLLFYSWDNDPFMPVEFSVAAYRFGHSMIRPIYRFNLEVDRKPIFSASADPTADLRGFRALPSNWGFDWRFFFDLTTKMDPKHPRQKAYKIDTSLVNPLGALPAAVATGPSSLAERNLLRSKRLGLPSGQSVARAMGIPPLAEDDLVVGKAVDDPEERPKPLRDIAPGLVDNSPLWYYVLAEAQKEMLKGSKHLGALGGRIVAEVLIGLLAGDRLSYLCVEPSWQPLHELSDKGQFGIAQLIRFATSR